MCVQSKLEVGYPRPEIISNDKGNWQRNLLQNIDKAKEEIWQPEKIFYSQFGLKVVQMDEIIVKKSHF